jgi:hypothetical protein
MINSAPTVTIYRDNQLVVDLLQQGFSRGFLTESSSSQSNSSTTLDKRNSGKKATASFKANATGIANINAGGSFDYGTGKDKTYTGSQSGEDKFLHTEAFALHHIFNELQQANQIQQINQISDAQKVNVGDFVEFSATFRPNEVSSILDVFTPELTGEIAKNIARRATLKALEDPVPIDQMEQWKETRRLEESIKAETASLIIRGLINDLRSQATREYYATIPGHPEALTAVLACESSAFITADPDRVLDGQYRVFGKVISGTTQDASIFSRSKLLARIQPTTLNQISSIIQKSADMPIKNLSGGDMTTLGKLFDLSLPSIIEGYSFNILPIAIYI